MRNQWYSDNRDLVKWAILLHLARQHETDTILQLAYLRPSTFGDVEIDGRKVRLPIEILDHFRRIGNIESLQCGVSIQVLNVPFQDRKQYLASVIDFVGMSAGSKRVVFLDPDTGLQPKKPTLKHVLNGEAEAIWRELKKGDVFVLYQHQTNRNGQPWLEPKRRQLASALDLPHASVKCAQALSIARDVAFLYCVKDPVSPQFDT